MNLISTIKGFFNYFTLYAGGGGSSAPSQQNVTQTSIPEYARPYVETALGKTAALTDINQNPYQPYQGQQVAGLSPMQQQAMGSIGGQQVASQLDAATNLATAAGMGGIGAQQTAQGLQQNALTYGGAAADYGRMGTDIGLNANMNANAIANQARQNAQGYGAAGAGYGAAASQFGSAGAQQAQQSSQQAQRQAAMYGAQGAQFGAQGADQALQAQRAAEGQADMYGQMGASYGAQAAGMAPQAQQYGDTAAQMGQAGMGYGAQGAGIGQRGVGAAEQGFGAQDAYRREATSADAMGQYMSPYMQNVVQQQQKDAIRQADIARQGTKSQAVKAGAFGGSRAAIVEAENQRGLQDRLANIQATGSQSAFEKAQQAQQYGAGLGIQGLQAGYQGLQTGMAGTAQGMQGAETGMRGQQAGLAGIQQAGQLQQLGMQGAGLGLQGTGQRLQAAQVGLQGTGQGIQGAQAGLQGVGQQVAGGQLGLQGAQTGIQGAQAGMQGTQVGLSSVGQELASGQLGLQGAQSGMQGTAQGMQGAQAGLAGVQAATGAGQYGLQGLGAAGSAASTLGALGQTQYGQQMGINQAQMQAGALQQAQEQRGLDVAYQQYQDQLNYPYKQLAFQSDMFRGLPLSQSATTMYQNTGAMAPQLLGAGIAAYGATQRVKEGGLIKGYAEGGMTTVDPSVPSSIGPQALSSRLAKLSDEQLMAYARTVKDAVALAEVKGEIQRRQEAREPQGQMPASTVAQSMMPQEAPQVPVMAGGGIVALNRGGNEKSEFRRDIEALREDVKLEDERAGVLKPLAKTAGPFGYFTTSPGDRATARATLGELQNAPMEDIRAYRDTGVIPRSADPLGDPSAVAGMAAVQAREAERRQSLAQAANNLGSPEGYEGQAPAPRPSRGIDEMPEEGASPVTGTAPSSAPPGTVPGGIVPSRAPVAGAPAGQAPAGQAPAGQAPAAGAPAAPAGIVPSSRAPTAMAGGAVPIANPGDPLGWGAYKANVDDMAKLDPEQRAVIDDMRKRSERKMARAEKQEKNVMSETTVAMGLAMMGGLNLPDGVRRMAEQGGKKYFESSAAASKAIEAADDAQGAFDQYQLSLKQGNKKVAADMYGKFHNSMLDYQGKIQAASISAGASRENAAAQREATAANREMQERRYDLDRDAMMQRHQETILAQKDNFKTRMAELGENRRVLELKALEDRELRLIAEARATERGIYDRFAPRLQQFEFKLGSGKPLSPQDQKAYDALVKEFNAEAKKAAAPVRKKLDETLIRQGEVMGISAPSSAGSNSGFRVVGVR